MSYRYALIVSICCLLAAPTPADEPTPDTAPAPEAATTPDAMQRKGLVLRGNRWVLREEAAKQERDAATVARSREGKRKVRHLLRLYAGSGGRARRFAVEALRAVDDVHKLEPLASALRSPNRGLRIFAAQELGRLRDERALRPLLHRAVHDGAADVRHAAIAAAKSIGDANLIAPLVKALGSRNAVVRMNAAEAIGRAGDVRGIRYLVYRFEAHGGGAPRTYFLDGGQTSFIQDFDVEVASTAFIADPIVGTMQEGTVLDVTVVATEQVRHFAEREVVHGALRRLTGAKDVPNETGAWAAWLKKKTAR